MIGTIIDAPEIPVRYVAGDASKPIPSQAPVAFEHLEATMDSLRGQKFYGLVHAGEYRACVAISSQQSDEILHLPEFTIPAGRYFCRRVKDFFTDTSKIGHVVEKNIQLSLAEGW